MKCIDSSVWLSYEYKQSSSAKDIIDSEEQIYTSTIVLFEVERILLRNGERTNIIDRVISFIRRRAHIIELTKNIAHTAAEISNKYQLSTADSIILATARETKSILITGDKDFLKIKDVIVLT